MKMANSRKQAWVGNSAAVIDLFAGANYKPVTATQKALSKYIRRTSYNWGMFLTKAEPFRQRIQYVCLKTGKIVDRGLDTNLFAPYLCRTARVLPVFSAAYDLQSKTNFPSVTTVGGFATDEQLLEARLFKDTELRLGFSFISQRRAYEPMGLCFTFGLEHLKRAFGEQCLVDRVGGNRSPLRFSVVVDGSTKFLAYVVNQGRSDKELQLMINEDYYYEQFSKRVNFTPFHEVTKQIYDALEPIAISDGFVTATELENEISRKNAERLEAENKNKLENISIIAKINKIGFPQFIHNAITIAMGGKYKEFAVMRRAVPPVPHNPDSEAIVLNTIWKSDSDRRVQTIAVTHVSITPMDISKVIRYTGSTVGHKLIKLDDPNALMYLNAELAAFNFKDVNKVDIWKILKDIQTNAFGHLTSQSVLTIGEVGFGVYRITLACIYRNTGYSVSFEFRSEKTNSTWVGE